MAKIRILTDVTAYLRPELVEQYGITVLPLEIRYGDARLAMSPGDPEGPARLFQHMASGTAMQSQALFTPAVFQQAFERLCRESEEVLVLLSSGKLSDGVARAQAVARSFAGRSRITIMDTLASSWGLGLIVEAAARAAELGMSLEGLIRLVRGLVPRIYMVFFVERLDYLEMKGRIGRAQSLLGTMLHIRPILLMEDGEIIPMEKVRTRALAIEKLADFVAEFAAVERLVILRGPLDETTEEVIAELKKLLAEIQPRRRFPVIEYDPVLASHLGPQAVGVTVYERV